MKYLKKIGQVSAFCLLTASFLSGAPTEEILSYSIIRPFPRYTYRVVFKMDDPCAFIYYSNNLGSHLGMGLKVFRVKTGFFKRVLIPTYVVNLYNTIRSADDYFKKKGLSVRRTPFMPPDRNAYIYNLGSDEKGAYLGSWPYDQLRFHSKLTLEELFTIPIHEWFHVIQTYHWSAQAVAGYSQLTGRNSQAHNVAEEGTAEWARDLPIPIKPVGVYKKGPLGGNADEFNGYFISRYPNWFSEIAEGLFNSTKDEMKAYNSVFFWKVFAEKAGVSEDDLSVIKQFWDQYSSYWKRGKANFIEAAGKVLIKKNVYEGDTLNRFKRLFMDYIGASILQKEGEGFQDDAFKSPPKNNALYDPSPKNSRTGHSSSKEALDEMEAGVAGSDKEICRRLKKIERTVSIGGIKPFGAGYLSVGPFRERLKGKKTLRVEETSTLFLMVRSDRKESDLWDVVAFEKQKGHMKKLPLSLHDPTLWLDDYPTSLCTVENFSESKEPLWIGFGNLDGPDSKGAKDVYYSFMVTPVFQKFSLKGKKDSTVHLIKPKEKPKSGFKPGDQVTFTFDMSDSIHVGASDNITPDRSTLKVSLVDTQNTVIPIKKYRLSCSDTILHRYRLSFSLPAKLDKNERYTLHLSVRSFLKLGEKDINTDKSFSFEIYKKLKVELVVIMKERRREEPFYKDPGDIFKPIPPGRYTLEIYFSKKMNTGKKPEISYGARSIDGKWERDQKWSAALQIPQGKPYLKFKGVHTLSIQAEAEDETFLDSDPDKDGNQPDKDHRFLIDSYPPWLEKIEVLGQGKTYYEGEWKEGPLISRVENYKETFISPKTRKLNVRHKTPFPKEEKGTVFVFLRFSKALKEPPKVTIGPVKLKRLESKDKLFWTGEFNLEELQSALNSKKDITIKVSAEDSRWNRLDANPGTVCTVKETLDEKTKPWWKGYESKTGVDDGQGGDDTWHKIPSSEKGKWKQINMVTGKATPIEVNLDGNQVSATVLIGGQEATFRGKWATSTMTQKDYDKLKPYGINIQVQGASTKRFVKLTYIMNNLEQVKKWWPMDCTYEDFKKQWEKMYQTSVNVKVMLYYILQPCFTEEGGEVLKMSGFFDGLVKVTSSDGSLLGDLPLYRRCEYYDAAPDQAALQRRMALMAEYQKTNADWINQFIKKSEQYVTEMKKRLGENAHFSTCWDDIGDYPPENKMFFSKRIIWSQID